MESGSAAFSYFWRITTGSAGADLLSAASTHVASVDELASVQLDRKALSLGTRKSDNVAGAAIIVRNHRTRRRSNFY
jgi:hypothetical protein